MQNFRIEALTNLSSLFNVQSWVGLIDPKGEEIVTAQVDNTTRFLSNIDQKAPSFTSGDAGVFPWFRTQPEDLNGNQDCIAFISEDSLISDFVCSQGNRELMCQLECIVVVDDDDDEVEDEVEDEVDFSIIALLISIILVITLLIVISLLLYKTSKLIYFSQFENDEYVKNKI